VDIQHQLGQIGELAHPAPDQRQHLAALAGGQQLFVPEQIDRGGDALERRAHIVREQGQHIVAPLELAGQRVGGGLELAVELLLKADQLDGEARDQLGVGRHRRQTPARLAQRREALGTVLADHLLQQVQHLADDRRAEAPERVELAQRLAGDGLLAVLAAQQRAELRAEQHHKPLLAQRVVAHQGDVQLALAALGRQRRAGEDTDLLGHFGQGAVALGLLAPVRGLLEAREQQGRDPFAAGSPQAFFHMCSFGWWEGFREGFTLPGPPLPRHVCGFT
jgi:hypothetical protein